MSGLDIRRNAVMIDMVCNDPDNGLFNDCVEQIQIGSDFLELELRRGPAPRFTELDGAVRLSGKRWPVLGCKYGVGNWCWNGYWFAIPVAVEFLVWLQARRIFHCSLGEQRIYNIWNADRRIDEDRDFLSRMLGKPSTFHHCSHNSFRSARPEVRP